MLVDGRARNHRRRPQRKCHCYDDWASGSLNVPLASMKVDEQLLLFLETNAVRKAAAHFLPKHIATAGWKHRNMSRVKQEGLPPMPKDRGAEEGDVDGLQERSLSLGVVAVETRGRVSAQQAAGNFPRIGVDDPSETQRCKQNTQTRRNKFPIFSLMSRETHRGFRPTSYFAGKWRH